MSKGKVKRNVADGGQQEQRKGSREESPGWELGAVSYKSERDGELCIIHGRISGRISDFCLRKASWQTT